MLEQTSTTKITEFKEMERFIDWMPCLNVYHLQDGEVLQNAVHHVLLRQVLELMNKVDHILAHG